MAISLFSSEKLFVFLNGFVFELVKTREREREREKSRHNVLILDLSDQRGLLQLYFAKGMNVNRLNFICEFLDLPQQKAKDKKKIKRRKVHTQKSNHFSLKTNL